jgi:hypothetical protein
LVDALALTEEHNLELLSVWVVVDELSQPLVDCVVLSRDVNCDTLLQLYYVVLESFDFDLCVLELSEQLERCLVGLVDLVLESQDVV